MSGYEQITLQELRDRLIGLDEAREAPPLDFVFRYPLLVAPPPRALAIQFFAHWYDEWLGVARKTLGSVKDRESVERLEFHLGELMDEGERLGAEPDLESWRSDLAEDWAHGAQVSAETLARVRVRVAFGDTPAARDLRQRAEAALKLGVQSDGLDRMDALREAAGLFGELVSGFAEPDETLAHLDLAWIRHRLGSPNEALSSLAELDQRRAVCHPLVVSLADRLAAWIASDTDSHNQAFSSCARALLAEPDGFGLVEAVVHGARARRSETGPLLENLAQSWPGMVPIALAEPEVATYGVAVGRLLDRVSDMHRRAAARACDGWNTARRRAERIESNIGQKIYLPGPLTAGEPELRETIGSVGYFGSVRVREVAESRHRETVSFITASLRRMIDESARDVEEARSEVEKVLQQREMSLQVNESQIKQMEAAAAEELKHALNQMSNMQAGCGWASGIGCAGFIAYLVASLVGIWHGATLRLDNPFVIGFALISGIPAIFTLIAHFVHSLRHMALESELRARVDAARREAHEHARAIEQESARKLPPLRERLADAEKQHVKLTEALLAIEGRSELAA